MNIVLGLKGGNRAETTTGLRCQGCGKKKRQLKYLGKYCSRLCKSRSANSGTVAKT